MTHDKNRVFLFFNQLNNFVILSLLVATGIALWLRADVQALVVIGFVLLGILLRAAREYRSGKRLATASGEPAAWREEFSSLGERFETAALGLCLLIFILGLRRNIPVLEIFILSASLASMTAGLSSAALCALSQSETGHARCAAQQTMRLLISVATGAIFLTLGALFMNWLPPLTAVQVLLLGLLAETLAPEIILNLKLADTHAKTFPRTRAALEGLMLGLLSLLALAVGQVYAADAAGGTMAFATLCIAQLTLALHLQEESLFTRNPFGNKRLLGAFLVVVLLTGFFITGGSLATILRLTPLTAAQWLIVTGLCLLPIAVLETEKRLPVRYNNGKKRQSSSCKTPV